ncbi:MAG: glutathione peroxidase [Ignavibacteria bacterium GWF2_33_9]|nr:MAG: glutathione peroxidase [Ignavibacteria bacterium GWF2_33_9]
MEGKSIYDFQVEDIKGNTINLSDYKGKVLVFVNVASLCGFTPHYAGLEELYEQYKDQGLVILGFPCNQFGEQEPGTEEEILQFCQRTYGVTFPMFSKIDVNGENTHPLYKWLKQNTKGDNQGKDIKWNFTKFLIDREGNVVERFAHNTKPESMEIRIQSFLKKNI